MPWRAPFTVTAIKMSELFSISSSALSEVISHFLSGDDADEKQVLTNLENEYAQCVGKMGMEAERAARVAKKKGSFVIDAAAMAEDKELQQLQAEHRANTEGAMLEMKNTVLKLDDSLSASADALANAKELAASAAEAFQLAMGGVVAGSGLLVRAENEEALESDREEGPEEEAAAAAVSAGAAEAPRRQRRSGSGVAFVGTTCATSASRGGGGSTAEARRKELEKKAKAKQGAASERSKACGLVGKQALSSSVRDSANLDPGTGAVASMVM